MRRLSDDDEVDPRDPYATIKRDRTVVTVSLSPFALAVSDGIGGVLDLLIFLSTHDRTRRLRVRHGKRIVQLCEVCDGF